MGRTFHKPSSGRSFYMTDEIEKGVPLRCSVCGTLMARSVRSACDIVFDCPKCKSKIHVEMCDPAPFIKEKNTIIEGSTIINKLGNE